MAVKVAQEWLNACSGCEISIVDMGERLLDVLALIEFVHSPVLMDHKYLGATRRRQAYRNTGSGCRSDIRRVAEYGTRRGG